MKAYGKDNKSKSSIHSSDLCNCVHCSNDLRNVSKKKERQKAKKEISVSLFSEFDSEEYLTEDISGMYF